MVSVAYRALLKEELQRAPSRSIISIVQLVIEDAQSRGASDIHIDPSTERTLIRLRIDGSLSDSYVLPIETHVELIARLKILSRLRIDERFSPQDGRFRFKPRGTCPEFDIRISVLPSQYGESVVLRLLVPRSNPDSFTGLGLLAHQASELERSIARLHGLILIAGPTGSGKTTTLYALMHRLAKTDRSIVSIEDPVEYSLPGIRQVQVMPQHRLTFAEGLRALLRQDPDVIVVGEIRDADTAALAISAAHTGHMVLSTVHASGVQDVRARLEELGVSAARLSAARPLIVAQKLVKLPCSCASVDQSCRLCKGNGYAGREGRFELLYV